MIEEGTLVSLEEFKNNQQLKEKVKEGIRGLVSILFKEISSIITFISKEDAIFQLMKLGVISPILSQELLDILSIVDNLDNEDDEVIYGMLVRIMEDIEETINNIEKYKVKNVS
ncbi:hypothetical protein V6M85_05355 [Sulfolobus tengchongensis]|uniref:Uncharacterized protein n=1 Tax=Sulfolobus tengchongensis TaxID=207809 RepID=A0AAX4L3V9_9CREN